MRTSTEASRYRTEDGEPCIDVRVRSIEQIFDNRDPAPFRERDLDPDLAEYLVDAGEDLVGIDRIRVVFWVDRPCTPAEVEQAFRAHFEGELERLRRGRQRHRRTGQIALALAIVIVIALVTASQLVGNALGGTLGTGLKEGLVISSWVVMWRPVEVLIYDWIPIRHQRKALAKLLAATVDVRVASNSKES